MRNIPDKAKEAADEHINMIDSRLPDFLKSYYIYGSVALGAFKYGESDIDFIAVVKRKATETDLNTLKRIHSAMHKGFPKTILDGMYILVDDLDSLCTNKIPCLRFNDGRYKGIGIFDKNSPDAFILKKHGIAVKGQAVESLKYEVDFDILIYSMRDNLNTYWLQWVHACRRFPSLKHMALLVRPKSIEWGVLGVSRLYYTFREKDITTKVGAGEYALHTVPQRWHRILNEAMRLRKGNKKTFYSSIFERRNDALHFMEYIIQECNSLFEKNNKS